MPTKAEFVSKLTDIVQSVPGFSKENCVLFLEQRNHSCGAFNYKVGLGLSNASLMEIRDKLIPVLPSFHTYNPPLFDIENDVSSPHYCKSYVRVSHLHFDPPALACNDKLNQLVDMTVARMMEKDGKKYIVLKPHWGSGMPFGMPVTVLYDLLDREANITINHKPCSREQIDRLCPEDVVSLPYQLPKQG